MAKLDFIFSNEDVGKWEKWLNKGPTFIFKLFTTKQRILILPVSRNNRYICIHSSYIKCSDYYESELASVICILFSLSDSHFLISAVVLILDQNKMTLQDFYEYVGIKTCMFMHNSLVKSMQDLMDTEILLYT